MIRTTITTLTLTAITMIAVATASPVLAAPPTDDPSAIAETTVASTDNPCVIETDFGTFPCLDLDWTLGGTFDTETASDEPTVIGGIVSDSVIGVVGDSADPELGTPIEEAPEAGGAEDMVEVVGGTDDLRDALVEAGIGLVETETASEPAVAAEAPAATPTTNLAAVSAEEISAPTTATAPTTVENSFVDEARIRTGRPDDTISEDAEAIIDVATAAASVLSFDHMMVALFVVLGMIGALGLATVVTVGFVLGRRNR